MSLRSTEDLVANVYDLTHLHGVPNDEPSRRRERDRPRKNASELRADRQGVLHLLLGWDRQSRAAANAG